MPLIINALTSYRMPRIQLQDMFYLNQTIRNKDYFYFRKKHTFLRDLFKKYE